MVLQTRKVVEVAAVLDRHEPALRLEEAHLLGDRVGSRDDRARLRRDEPTYAADGFLLQPRELRLVAAPVRMRGERIAEVGDPGCAGRPLHGGAQEVKRRRRRGREHDVDALTAHEPDRDRQRDRAPGDVLVGDEQPAPEKRRLRAEARDALLGDQLLRRARCARPDVAHSVDPGLGRQLELRVGRRRAGHVGREHVGLDPERGQVRRELQGSLDSSAAARGEVARDEEELHPRNGSGAR